MNYLAHGRRFVEQPYFLAGTAVPDWLNVVDRKGRVRAKRALPMIDDADPQVAAVAQGIAQHHHDDDWFHRTRAFAELSLQFTVHIRDQLPRDNGLRPGFLGHILVELLLDAVLIEEDSGLLDAYYDAVGQVDPHVVGRAVNRMSTKTTDDLPRFIQLFIRERFLYDYAEDAKLVYRLNQVLRRVKLAALPEDFQRLLPSARREVFDRKRELITPAGDAT